VVDQGRVVALLPGYIRLGQQGEAVNSDLSVPLNGAPVEAIDGRPSDREVAQFSRTFVLLRGLVEGIDGLMRLVGSVAEP
jgi:hypothetical protein